MTTHRRPARIGLGLLGAAALAFGLSAPAGAHISGDKSEVPAGGYTQVTFTVPHGCDDSPTTALAFQIPEGIVNAAPQVLPGWDVETTMEDLAEPIEGEGEAQTERVSEITWTAEAGNELPPHFRQVFTIGFQAPDTAGEDLVFPVIQTCVEGETAWIEEPVEGEDEPEHPAIVVAVGEAEADGHGHGAGEEDEADEGHDEGAEDGAADEAAADPVAASSADDSDDGGSDALGIGGLVLGALGLAAGGTALLRTRSASA